MRARSVAVAVLAAALLAGWGSLNGHSATSPTPGSAVPGVMVGVYLRGADGPDAGKPVAGASISVFDHPILIGPNYHDEPVALRTTSTDGAGRFSFTGLAPGTYYVGPTGTLPSGAAYARPVRAALTSSAGASVTVTTCSSCPAPA